MASLAVMTEVSQPDAEQQSWLRNIATSLCRSFPLVEREDMEQQLHLLWYEKWDVLRKFLAMPDEEKGKAHVLKCLRLWGIEYARSETAMIRGWRVEDMQHYSPRSVAEMLPFLFDPESWSSIAAKGGEGPASPKLKNQAGDALAIYADLTKAWGGVRDVDRDVLHRRFVAGVDLEVLAGQWGVNEDTARKRCERALQRLAERMSGLQHTRVSQLAPRGRRAVSNTRAQAMTGEHWSG